MSYSFHINKASKLTFAALTQQPGLADIAFVAGYPVPEGDFWPLGFTYVYRDKVTARALEIDYDGDHFQIRVFTASSPDDYRLAVDLACAVAVQCDARITPEDSETVDVAGFKAQFNASWCTQKSVDSITGVLQMFGDTLDKGHQVSGVTGLLTIGPKVYRQIIKDPDNATSAFFTRLTRLNFINDEDILQAPLNLFHDEPSGLSFRMSDYDEGVETLICDRKTVVAVASGENQHLRVGLADLADVLGDKAMWLSEDLLLLPALRSDDWQQLLKDLEPVALTQMSGYGFKPADDPYHGQTFGAEGGLSESEFNLLVYAPVAVFCLVAGADRKIDGKEINAFQKELISGIKVDSKILQSAVIEAASDFNAMVNYLINDGIDMDQLMQQVVEVIDRKLSSEEAFNFKVSLLRIGTIVAEASGGLFGVFGDKVCKAEKEVLAELTKLFGLVEKQD